MMKWNLKNDDEIQQNGTSNEDHVDGTETCFGIVMHAFLYYKDGAES